MTCTALLDLGDLRDARAWEEGCRALGIRNAVEPVLTPRPTKANVLKLLQSQPEWLFMSGHFSGLQLYDHQGNTWLTFAASELRVEAFDGTQTVRKSTPEFGLGQRCRVSMWSGCSVCRSKETIRTLFRLFGPHVLLGYASSTGAEITQAMLGGGFLRRGHFFENVASDPADPAVIRDAWLQAAINGYRGGTGSPKVDEKLFRAVDPDGQEWYAEAGKKVRGRKML